MDGQRSGNKTSPKKISQMRDVDYIIIHFTCINTYMILLDLHFSWSESVVFVYFIRKLFPTMSAELLTEFRLGHFMLDCDNKRPA